MHVGQWKSCTKHPSKPVIGEASAGKLALAGWSGGLSPVLRLHRSGRLVDRTCRAARIALTLAGI
jgi:hypothetical protein